jgi:hypothetical protein
MSMARRGYISIILGMAMIIGMKIGAFMASTIGVA